MDLDIQQEAIKKKEIFQRNPFNQTLKTHKLKGRLNNLWSFSVTPSYRIIFKYVSDQVVLFYDIGDHKIYR